MSLTYNMDGKKRTSELSDPEIIGNREEGTLRKIDRAVITGRADVSDRRSGDPAVAHVLESYGLAAVLRDVGIVAVQLDRDRDNIIVVGVNRTAGNDHRLLPLGEPGRALR